MYNFKQEIDVDSFDKFVEENKGTYLQTARWTNVKKAWDSKLYSGFCDDKRVLTCLVLIRNLPLAGHIWYISCGPVCDYKNEELFKEFSDFLSKEMKENKATCAIIDPLIPLRINGVKCQEGLDAHNLFLKCGYNLNSNIETYTYKHPVQVMINLLDDNGDKLTGNQILKHCDKGVRYSVRIGQKRGLVAHRYTYDEIKDNPLIMQDFISVMDETSDRNNFVDRDFDYNMNLVGNFKDYTDITLVYYDKKLDEKLENDRQKEKQALIEKLETAPQKKIKSIKNDIEAIDKNTVSYLQRVKETANYPENAQIPVAGGLTIRFAGVASCLFGGTKNIIRNNTRSSHYLNYLRICKSIEEDCSIHDLGYVLLKNPELTSDGTLGKLEPTDNFVGISEFKKSFGADYYEFVGEYILISHKFKYFLYSKLMPKVKKFKMRIVKFIRRRK